jgi:hypothetical protein
MFCNRLTRIIKKRNKRQMKPGENISENCGSVRSERVIIRSNSVLAR